MRRRVSPNNSVVRQLFPDNDVNRQSTNDNLANIIQETIATDHEVMKQRWNFDFRNEVPLSGSYEWFKSDGVNDWVGIKTADVSVSTKTDLNIEEKENDDTDVKSLMQVEKTPKGERKENIPMIRKRKTSLCYVADPAARRKISFD